VWSCARHRCGGKANNPNHPNHLNNPNQVLLEGGGDGDASVWLDLEFVLYPANQCFWEVRARGAGRAMSGTGEQRDGRVRAMSGTGDVIHIFIYFLPGKSISQLQPPKNLFPA
jgi:hypothetical protein